MKLNTFTDYRKFLKVEPKFYAYKAVVVSEVESMLEWPDITLEFSDDDFNTLCDFIYDLILDVVDLPVTTVVGSVMYYLAEEQQFTIDDLKNNSIDVRNFILENI